MYNENWTPNHVTHARSRVINGAITQESFHKSGWVKNNAWVYKLYVPGTEKKRQYECKSWRNLGSQLDEEVRNYE